MKLAVFVFALIGAILASPQEVPYPGARAAFPQDKPDPVVNRQGMPEKVDDRQDEEDMAGRLEALEDWAWSVHARVGVLECRIGIEKSRYKCEEYGYGY